MFDFLILPFAPGLLLYFAAKLIVAAFGPAKRISFFSLVEETPNAFAVSSAVAKVESRIMVTSILSSDNTPLDQKKLGASLFFNDTTGLCPHPRQIRQQLQVLRDLVLLDFHGGGAPPSYVAPSR